VSQSRPGRACRTWLYLPCHLLPSLHACCLLHCCIAAAYASPFFHFLIDRPLFPRSVDIFFFRHPNLLLDAQPTVNPPARCARQTRSWTPTHKRAQPASQPSRPSPMRTALGLSETRGIHGRDRYVCRLCPTAPAEYLNLSPVTPLKLLPASHHHTTPTPTALVRPPTPTTNAALSWRIVPSDATLTLY